MKSLWKALGCGLLGSAVLLTGCATRRSPESESAAPPAFTPAPAPAAGMPSSTQEEAASLDQAEPATLAEAEAWLEKARADLDRLALNDAPRASSGAAAPAEAAAPRPAPPRAEKRAADQAAEPAPGAPTNEQPAGLCETACKAFSSLSRASDAVCRLDSEGGQRCQRARQIQNDASRRVASCSCSK